MEKKPEQIKPQSQWEEKWLRESWTMPFGTIMNSFAVSNQGKGVSIGEWIIAIDKAYEKAVELVKKSLVDSQISKEDPLIDIEITDEP